MVVYERVARTREGLECRVTCLIEARPKVVFVIREAALWEEEGKKFGRDYQVELEFGQGPAELRGPGW